MRCLLEIGELEGVFRKMPPQGGQDLKTLQKHEILEIEFAIKKHQSKRKEEEAKKAKLYQKSQTFRKRREDEQSSKRSIEQYYRHLDTVPSAVDRSTVSVRTPQNIQ